MKPSDGWMLFWLRSRLQLSSRVCCSRLGGPCGQPRPSFLRGPREPDHDLAEAKQHVSPRNPPFRIHPADGAAQQKVRLEQQRWIITQIESEICSFYEPEIQPVNRQPSFLCPITEMRDSDTRSEAEALMVKRLL